MEERLRLVLWTFAGAGSFAVLGALFGALATAVAWRHGRAAGGFLGRTFVRFLAQLTGRAYSPAAAAALTGAADGAGFLACVGGVSALLAAESRAVEPVAGLLVFGGAVLLALTAAGIGMLAYALVRVGVWSVGSFFGGAAVGALGGARLAGVEGILFGTLAGAAVGAALAFARHTRLPDRRCRREGAEE